MATDETSQPNDENTSEEAPLDNSREGKGGTTSAPDLESNDGSVLSKTLTSNVNTETLKETQNLTKPQDVSHQTITTITTTNVAAQPYQRTSVGSLGNSSIAQLTVEQQLLKLKRDLESMVLKYAKSENENLQNQRKVEDLDKKLKRVVKDNDQLANRIKLLTNDKNQLTDTLNAKVAQLTVLEQKNSNFNQEQVVKLKEYQEEIKRLGSSNEELLKQIESYKSKEGELLDFCERLSMKHMMLQSELDEATKKVPNFKDDYDRALAVQDRLIKERDKLAEQIESINECLKSEQLCSKGLREELELREGKYRNQLDELQNEIKVIRRKHQLASKELIKEVKQLRTQLEKVGPSNGAH